MWVIHTLIIVLFKDWIIKRLEKLQKSLGTEPEKEPLSDLSIDTPISIPYEQISLAVEAANNIIMTLFPNIGISAKVKHIQNLLPQLIEINTGKSLSLDLPVPDNVGKKPVAEEN